MKLKLKQKKGISLIVLVITIIVMIILAAAIILALNSNNIVGRAHEAKTSSDESTLKEAASVVYAQYDLKTKTGKLDVSEISAEKYVKDSLKAQGFSKDNLKRLMVSNKGNIFIVKIPKGFVASDIETEDEVEEGLVIYEGTEQVSTDADAMTTRNQYVWIPVLDSSDFVRKEGYRSKVLQNTYVSNGAATEPFSKTTSDGIKLSETNDLTGEYAEYAKIKASVEKHGGFYIARYEAGTTNKRTDKANGTSYKEDGKTPDVLSQKDKYPYNFVGWGPAMKKTKGNVVSYELNQGTGAVELARGIYPENSKYEVVSTLCYGVQWDAIMNYMKNVKNSSQSQMEYIRNSKNMGWYTNNYKVGNLDHKTGIDVNTEKANMVKNVYDMAGNLFEWTMEAKGTIYRVYRGGDFARAGDVYPVSSRAENCTYLTSDGMGFRVALYIK